MKLLRKVSVSTQIALLCAAFVVPLVVSVVALIGKYQEQLDFTLAESEGLTAVAPLRQMAVRVLAGQDPAAAAGLVAVQGSSGGKYLTEKGFSDLKAGLGRSDPAEQLAGLATAILAVSDASNLTLDPEVPTFYAMDLTVNAMISMGRNTQALQTGVAALLQDNTEANRMAVAMAKGALQADAVRIETALSNGRTPASAAVYDGTLKPVLAPVVASTHALLDRLKAAPDNGTQADLAGHLSKVTEGWAAAETALDVMLRQRTAALQAEYRLTVGLCAGLAVLALLVAAVMSRGISGFLRQLRLWMGQVAAGQPVSLQGWPEDRSEVGRVVATVDKLNGDVQRAFRLMQMVEDMTSPVMTVDPATLRLVYLNGAGRAMIAGLEGSSAAGDWSGRPLSDLHAFDPADRQAIAEGAGLPRECRVSLWEEVFVVRMSAVHGVSGGYDTAMLIWQPVTRQVRLASRFDATVKRVVETVAAGVGAVDSGAGRLSETAVIALDRSTAALATTEEVNAAVQTVAAAVEELSASAQSIADRVRHAADVAADATREADATVAVIASMEDVARNIGAVASLISGIADQTNLLALNATIEAARAGEAGKGFAVVASAVKNLATQTGRATSDISRQLVEMEQATQASVRAVAAIRSVIAAMDGTTAEIAAAVSQQTAAAEEIARTMGGVARGSQVTASHVDGLRAAAGTTSREAAALKQVSESLTVQAETLSREVDAFLASVQAG